MIISSALLYVATEDNFNYLGPDDHGEIAKQIFHSRGPSGPNLEYLLKLANALEEMEIEDHHVKALVSSVEAIQNLN